ncbi:MAG TPA: hypothetical protein PLL10_04130 [Elusimicrobiales bacterium]|nr:hypothetical protein [Elusimicrobiales bacterium]
MIRKSFLTLLMLAGIAVPAFADAAAKDVQTAAATAKTKVVTQPSLMPNASDEELNKLAQTLFPAMNTMLGAAITYSTNRHDQNSAAMTGPNGSLAKYYHARQEFQDLCCALNKKVLEHESLESEAYTSKLDYFNWLARLTATELVDGTCNDFAARQAKLISQVKELRALAAKIAATPIKNK